MDILREENKKRIGQALFVLLVVLSAYFAVKIFGEVKETTMLGASKEPATISFSGHGEVTAVPDIANIYFTISKDGATVKAAQASVAVIEKKALDLLKEKGVEEKDIKTADASFNPKYDYKQAVCSPSPAMMNPSGAESSYPYYCPPGKQVITGYTASESITVKIRNTDDAGAIMQGLGTVGVSNLSGPNFAVDDEEGLKLEARKKAIADAKSKAEILAKDLGVSLGKITSFSDSTGGYPYLYGKEAMMDSRMASAPAAELPKGESTISSDVTITFEIR